MPQADESVVDALGLELTPASDVEGSGDEGLVITDVMPDSNAAEKGLQPGDVVLEVGGTNVASVSDVNGAIETAQANNRSAVLMRVRSGENTRFVAVSLKAAS